MYYTNGRKQSVHRLLLPPFEKPVHVPLKVVFAIVKLDSASWTRSAGLSVGSYDMPVQIASVLERPITHMPLAFELGRVWCGATSRAVSDELILT
jgi:hypothetical protein